MYKSKIVALFLVLLMARPIMITASQGTAGNSLFSGNESPEGVGINETYLNLARAISGTGSSSFSSAATAAASNVSVMQLPVLPDYPTEWSDSACFYSNSKSGKVGKKSNKIERFSTESGQAMGIISPATIYNGVMSSPGVRNHYGGDSADIGEVLANQTITNLLILEEYLKCAGAKVENLLTVKLHLSAQLFGENGNNSELALLPIIIFLSWWFTSTGIAPPTGEGGPGIPGVTWNFPTFLIEYVIAIAPPFGSGDGPDDSGNYLVMFEATAAV